MVSFNPADPAFLENPFLFYAMGRQLGALQVGSQGFWSVFGYEDCLAILRDHETWSSERFRPAEGETAPPANMLSSDPPAHSRLRGLVSQVFTPRMVEQLAPRIATIADALLDEAGGARELDLVAALSYPLPVIVIAEILGVPPEDRDRFKQWSDAVVSTLGTVAAGANPDQSPAQSSIEEMTAYFTKLAEERRVSPREDLLSGLVAAELEGSRLSFDELLSMLILLLVAGNETTTNLIGNAALELMAHPAQLARVAAEPALLPGAIEEILRYASPVQATVRRANHATTVAGKELPAGAMAITWLAAANRDPAAFADAETFDITRAPNRHLAFGHGPHFCLGAPLARLEAKVAFERLFARYSAFERLDAASLPRVPTFIMRGVRSLPVRLVAR